MKLRTGTSGFSYPAWKGSFYPEKLPNGEMLGYYADRLGAVEINNTFYRLPKASLLESWAEQTPPGFRFSLKASRRITHFARLGESAAEPTDYLVGVAATLGERLGAILFQLPPKLGKDVERLGSFLARLPAGGRYAFEFRHESWFDDAVYDRLAAHDAALVWADDGEREMPLVATAPWGYLRLRRESYDDEDLAEWVSRLSGQGWDEALCFFKHEDAGAGPRLAAQFAELAGGGGMG